MLSWARSTGVGRGEGACDAHCAVERSPTQGILGGHGRLSLEQLACDRRTVFGVLSRQVERRFVRLGVGVDVGPLLEKDPDHLYPPAVRREVEGRALRLRRQNQHHKAGASGGAERRGTTPVFFARWAAQSTYVPGIVHVNPLQAGQLLNDGVHIAGTCGLPEQEAAAPGHRQRQGALGRRGRPVRRAPIFRSRSIV